jgi:hypothetical protein
MCTYEVKVVRERCAYEHWVEGGYKHRSLTTAELEKIDANRIKDQDATRNKRQWTHQLKPGRSKTPRTRTTAREVKSFTVQLSYSHISTFPPRLGTRGVFVFGAELFGGTCVPLTLQHTRTVPRLNMTWTAE